MLGQDNQDLNKKLMELLDEQPPEIDINGAVVVRRQFFSHMRECMITFRPNGIQFNTACITLFEGVTHVLLMVDWEHKWFIIKPCDPDDKDGQRWCNIKGDARKTRMISGRDFAERLYKKMDWSKGRYYKICGTLARQIDTEDDMVLVFELEDAENYPMTSKARKTAGVDDAEIGSAELETLNQLEKQKEQEKKDRELAKAEGRVTRKAKREGRFPESWGDSLGVRYDQHQLRIEFTHLPSTGAEALKAGLGIISEDTEDEHHDK